MDSGGGSGPVEGVGAGHPPGGFADAEGLVRAAMGGDPALGLEAVARLRPLVDALEDFQVARARDAGWNWAEIAKKLGRHRQAVHREYAARSRALSGRRSTSPEDGGR